MKQATHTRALLVLSLICLVSTTEARRRDQQGWKIERTWERQPVVRSNYEDDGPWPLLLPRRTEKTVILKLSYGSTTRSEAHICRPAEEDDSNSNVLDEFEANVPDAPVDLLEGNEDDTMDHDEYFKRRLSGGGEEGEEELFVHVAYEDIYDTIIFLTVAWVAGRIALYLGMPTLVGEIVTGFLLGPPLADYVPQPEAMVLIGEIGLIGLLLEAGIEMDLAQLKQTGTRSFAMACTGATLPLGVGIGLAFAAGADVRAAIALGACFAPTSLGVASNALNAGNVANTPVGQLIVSTCVIDDVIGLILLSMLEVIVKEDAQIFEYFIPIISSFGYLLVLGWSGLTWMPKVIEHRILPRFPERLRDMVAFAMMMGLLLAYLPLLNYSKSSYLTGAFLAGLTFSQIHSIHSTFVNETGALMNWLLRIFFAASIGFQVPITMFGDAYIIQWGFIFYVCVLAKLPLGLFVPKFEDAIPDGFPYNPYVRDVVYVSVAMTCRGEFSFVIASFALQEGLFTPELYSAIVFAVLLSSITSPFVLLSLIKHYNRKSEAFLQAILSEEDLDGKTPLYLAIQTRTPNQWGLQETIHSAVGRAGLIVIDHRSWHPRGLDAIVMTELYVEDPAMRVPLKKVTELSQAMNAADVSETGDEAELAQIIETIEARTAAVKKALEEVLGHKEETRIVVTWWQPSALKQEDSSHTGVPKYEDANTSFRERLKTEAQSEMTVHESFGIHMPQLVRRQRNERMTTPKMGSDMWDSDELAQQAAMADVYTPQPSANVVAGRYRYGRRRKIQSDMTGIMIMEAAPSTQEHLAGFVRRDNEAKTDFGMLHPGDNRASEKDMQAEARRKKQTSDMTGFFERKKNSFSSRRKSQSDLTGLGIKGKVIKEEEEVKEEEGKESDNENGSVP